MSRLLIYDSELTGHHGDYLRAVFQYIESCPEEAAGLEVVFMVPAAMCGMLGTHASPASVSFYCLTDDEIASLSQTSKRKRSYLELDLISRVAKEKAVDEIFLMNLDYFQVALASSAANKTGSKISGILFQPYTRFEMVATEHKFLPGEYFRALRKRFRLTALLRNPCISRLCVPCDQAAVDKLVARHGHQADFKMLPEPYFAGHTPNRSQEVPGGAINALPDIDLREQYSIAPDARIILVFGHILARKNVPNLLRALRSACLRFKGSIALLIIGSASDTYRLTLEQEIAQFRQTPPTARLTTQVIFDCNFANSATMKAAFAQTDIVAMPYFKAYQSSGILFLAARYRKPVITANVGLMNELVAQYGLGETADPLDADAIAAAIDKLLQTPLKLETDNAFFRQHTPEKHAACILGRAEKSRTGKLAAESQVCPASNSL